MKDNIKQPAKEAHTNLTLDPFYSDENMLRLRKSVAQMEATGGTIHKISEIQIQENPAISKQQAGRENVKNFDVALAETDIELGSIERKTEKL